MFCLSSTLIGKAKIVTGMLFEIYLVDMKKKTKTIYIYVCSNVINNITYIVNLVRIGITKNLICDHDYTSL